MTWTLQGWLYLPAPGSPATGTYAYGRPQPAPPLEEIRATCARLAAEQEQADAALDEALRETAQRTGRSPAEIAALTLAQLEGTPEELREARRDLESAIGRLSAPAG